MVAMPSRRMTAERQWRWRARWAAWGPHHISLEMIQSGRVLERVRARDLMALGKRRRSRNFRHSGSGARVVGRWRWAQRSRKGPGSPTMTWGWRSGWAVMARRDSVRLFFAPPRPVDFWMKRRFMGGAGGGTTGKVGLTAVDVGEFVAASLEAAVDPEVLFGGFADVFFHECVDACGIGAVVARGEVFDFGEDVELIGAVGFADAEEGDDGGAGHGGEAAGGGVGEGGDAEEGEDGGEFGFFALIGCVPDDVAVLECADECAEVVHGDGGAEFVDAAAAHLAGDDAVVGFAEEAAHGEFAGEHAATDFEGGEVCGEEEDAFAFGFGGLEVFAADDFVGWELVVGCPPGDAGFEEADAHGAVVVCGEGAALGVGDVREAELEVDVDDVSADAEDVAGEPAEGAADGGLEFPGESADLPEQEDGDPRGPERGVPERGFAVVGRHGGVTLWPRRRAAG